MIEKTSENVAPLAPTEVATRIDRVRELLEEHRCDALLVTKRENIAYLTGFSGSSAMLLIGAQRVMLTTDGRYKIQAGRQLELAKVSAEIVIGNAREQLLALVGKCQGVARLGLEASAVTWSASMRFADEFSSELVPTEGIVEALRLFKDGGEVARIERACDIADEALLVVKGRLCDEVREFEFAAELEYAMRRLGSEGASFETIVASGPNGALPHARPGTRIIASGDLVVVDFGAIIEGYHSDMTRTFVVDEPSASQREQIEAVMAAQQAGVDALAPGVACSEIDRICREVLVEAGFGEFFTHSTGHGVGREIHEAPSVGAGATDSLSKGMVVTVEPGAYVQKIGGVRIEDTLVMTDDGARPLTKSTKDYQL